MRKGDFAKSIGITRQTLYNYMSGRTEPNWSEAVEIIKKTGEKDIAICDIVLKGKAEDSEPSAS